MHIRKYNKIEDQEKLMKLIQNEGEDWECYSSVDNASRYKKALENSITYVAYNGDVLCGYSRSMDDNGFYIYVCDLLVMPEYRGQNIGRKLMECLYLQFPNHIVYVMSDVDEYYKKLGYKEEGSIYEVTKQQLND